MRRLVIAALARGEMNVPTGERAPPRPAGGQPEGCVREPARPRARAVQADKRAASGAHRAGDVPAHRRWRCRRSNSRTVNWALVVVYWALSHFGARSRSASWLPCSKTIQLSQPRGQLLRRHLPPPLVRTYFARPSDDLSGPSLGQLVRRTDAAYEHDSSPSPMRHLRRTGREPTTAHLKRFGNVIPRSTLRSRILPCKRHHAVDFTLDQAARSQRQERVARHAELMDSPVRLV